MITIEVSPLLATLTLLGLGVVQWLVAKWLTARLEKSIQHEYDKKLEDYRFEQLQRQKAETIARFFAKWIKYRNDMDSYLSKEQQIDFFEELNQMSIELSLWIKDEELLNDLMACLQRKPGSKDIRTLIGGIRKLVLNQEDKFNPQTITLWPSTETENIYFKKQ